MVAWIADARKLGWRDWVSIAWLAAALVVLGVALVMIWIEAAHPSTTSCHNPPVKMIPGYSQLTGIAACIAGLVVGRVFTRPVVSSRTELNDRLVPTRDSHKHAHYALLTQASLTAALLFITFLVTYESLTLWRQVWPITYYMRCAAEAATWQTYTVAFFFCLLVGRWLWLPKTPS